jgi:hypothetical protein
VGDQRAAVLLGNGNATFTAGPSQDADGPPWQVAVGDVDGDGNVHAALANAGGGSNGALLRGGKSSSTLKVKTPDKDDQLAWKWAGKITPRAGYGDPVTTDPLRRRHAGRERHDRRGRHVREASDRTASSMTRAAPTAFRCIVP